MRDLSTLMHCWREQLPTCRMWPLLVAFLIGCGMFGDNQDLRLKGGEDAPTEKPRTKSEASTPQDEATSVNKKNLPDNPFPNRSPAPSLDGGVDWLNTRGEINLKDLRGKIVILDFWTFCCINCIHILPDLKFLEHKYPNELVVIGVHSAKFDNEKESENIRRAIVRYEIEHPVVNDAEMTIWRKFGVRSWPTIGLIDPEGNYCGYASGEGNRELLDEKIQQMIAYHRAKGTLDETPVEFSLERRRIKGGALKFPGKLLADEPGGRLFISDSNHNRIVIADLNGELQETIGNGAIGEADGDYSTATFDHPQGLALEGETLYVADTENHLIRAIDLKEKRVRTLAGTGKQAEFRSPGGEGSVTALNSPWDLLLHEGKLYIAMAGPHQIWDLDLKSNRTGPYAGSGREDIKNGSLETSALAQPSGIVTDGKYLYVVDSEGSAVRQIPLDPNGEVTTIVGTSDLAGGRSLFEFGDIDGEGENVRLQHPLGITLHEGMLYVADSYNHKIKKIDVQKKTSQTWLGTGKPGTELKPVQLSEPAGVAIARGKLYIADTNNHRILVSDLGTQEASELVIRGLTPPNPPVSPPKEPDPEDIIAVDAQTIKQAESVSIEVTLPIPSGFKLNPESPVVYRIRSAGEQTLVPPDQLDSKQEGTFNEGKGVFPMKLLPGEGRGDILLEVTYGYCREGTGGVCKLGKHFWKIPVQISKSSEQSTISLSVPKKK